MPPSLNMKKMMPLGIVIAINVGNIIKIMVEAIVDCLQNNYANKDNDTLVLSDWTEWSLDYPEKKEYRTISNQTGYRWYYMDGNNKVYWNSGTYYPTKPDEKYTQKEKESVTMYRYQDKMWRWYNGKKRTYSGYMSNPIYIYAKRDDDIFNYTNWSQFTSESKKNASNTFYREEETKTYSRYRISYSMQSFLKLNTYVDKTEFEKTLQSTVPELMNRTDMKVDIQYKFIYRKK